MLLLLSVLSNTLKQIVILVFGMIRTLMMCWLGILMLTRLVMLMIVIAHLVGAFTWE